LAIISDAQAAYFKRVLEEVKNPRWTFVIMHKRAWKNPVKNWIEIENALGDRPRTYLAGHDHYYEYYHINNREYIGMGASGGKLVFPQLPGFYHHFLFITMEEKPVIASIMLDSVFDKNDIPVNRHVEMIGPGE